MISVSQAEEGQSNKLIAWFMAARLPSLFYILPPLVLGQLFALLNGGTWHEEVFFLSLFYGTVLQLFIVFANDLADYEADRFNENPTIFSGGSRVLVNNYLSFRQLMKGAFVVLSLTLMMAPVLAYKSWNLSVLALALLGPVLLWLYSFPPFRFSYRGGGELLQAFGLAFVLPLLGFLLQGGVSLFSCLALCLALFPSQLACAMSTAIPDAVSDARSSKNTFVVVLGPYKSCSLIFLLHLISLALSLAFLWFQVIFGGVTNSFLYLLLPQCFLTAFLLGSFYKRQINLFVFFSLAQIFYFVGYFIFLSL